MKRQEELMQILLKSTEPITTSNLAKILNVSSRTIRTDLAKVESEVLTNGLTLEKKPHIGVWIEGTIEQKDRLFLNITGKQKNIEPYTKEYRRSSILVHILLENNKIYLDQFAEIFFVSRSTIEKDLIWISDWLKDHNLQLLKKSNEGFYVEGNEENIRNAVGLLANELNGKEMSIESLLETYLDMDIKAVEDIVYTWNHSYEMGLSEVNIDNLAFHASIMLVRIAQKKSLKANQFNELNSNEFSYKQEFNELIQELSEYSKMDIPKAESDYLLMHLYGMYLNEPSFIENSLLNDLRIVAERIGEDFIKNLDQIVALDLASNVQFKQSLILHLLPTVYRLKYGLNLYNPLLSEIKTNYPGSYSMAKLINSSFEKYLGIEASEEEVAYVALHISIVVEQSSDQIQAAVVCSMGIGVSRFLSVKLNENFPNIEFIHCSSDEIQKIESCKYILSTVKLNIDRSYLMINPLLKDIDIERIRTLIYGNITVNKNNFSLQTIMIAKQPTDRLTVLQEMSKRLQLSGAVTPSFLESVLKREMMGSTEIGNGIVLTHGFHESVKRTQFAFYKLDYPILWHTEKVNFIVLLAVAKADAKNIMQMNWLYKMLNNEEIKRDILSSQTEKEIYKILIDASRKD